MSNFNTFNFKYIAILAILIVLIMCSLNISFAQDNNNTITSADSNQYDKSMLLISDNGGTNIFDSAANEVLNNYSNVNIQVRSSNQISTMKEDELYELVDKSDIVMANWLTTDADSVFTNLLLKYPNLSNKEMFLILETSSSSQLKIFNLVKNEACDGLYVLTDEFRNQLRKNKDYVQSSNFIWFKNKKNCREYKHTVGQILNQTAKQISFDLNKTISKAHSQEYIKEFVNKLKTEEFIYHKLNENRISQEQAQDIRQEIEYGPTR